MKKLLPVISILLAFGLALCAGCVPGAGPGPDDGETEGWVSLRPSSAELWEGETYQLGVEVFPEDAPITWTSDNEEVAIVTGGLVHALNVGTATITASTPYASDTCVITVADDPTLFVDLSAKSLSLTVGETKWVTASARDNSPIAWSSDDPAVATVENGLITAVGEGMTRIAASSKSAGTAYCVVRVSLPLVHSVILTPATATIAIGETFALHASATDGSSLTWGTENGAVARVDKDGNVTGVSAGTVRITATSATAGSASCTVTVTERSEEYTLRWSDEFDEASLNEDDWEYQEGIRDNYHGNASGPENWGNNELQYYTRDAVSLRDGNLVITARREGRGGKEFTSARITTRDRHIFTYGYFEARMILPVGNGMWPAFWMLPQPVNFSSTNSKYGGWPASGEIDIMEAKGRLPDRVGTTLHFGPAVAGSWQSHYISQDTQLTTPISEWHTYGLEWTEDRITFYVDRVAVHTIRSSQWYSRNAADDPNAPFDVDFYLLFDLAVGGNFDGGVRPDPTFTSAEMLIDYVRVYQK